MSVLKSGQTVEIFEDPITQQKPEGTATLMKLRNTVGEPGNFDYMERWHVKFSDGFKCDRWIQPKEEGK